MIGGKLKTGDVVQICPDVPNAAVRGCFITVTEMSQVQDPNSGEMTDAIRGYITSPGHSDSIQITMTVPDFDHVEYIGSTKYLHESEWVTV